MKKINGNKLNQSLLGPDTHSAGGHVGRVPKQVNETKKKKEKGGTQGWVPHRFLFGTMLSLMLS